jgi:hypothetical protein
LTTLVSSNKSKTENERQKNKFGIIKQYPPEPKRAKRRKHFLPPFFCLLNVFVSPSPFNCFAHNSFAFLPGTFGSFLRFDFKFATSPFKENLMMIVMKFGGTSVQDAAAIRNVANLIERERARTPLVAVSACSGVTNALIAIAQKSAQANGQEAMKSILALRDRHCGIAKELFDRGMQQTDSVSPDNSPSARADTITRDCQELKKLAQSLPCSGVTPRTLDQFTAFGERWSSLLLSRSFCNAASRRA